MNDGTKTIIAASWIVLLAGAGLTSAGIFFVHHLAIFIACLLFATIFALIHFTFWAIRYLLRDK